MRDGPQTNLSALYEKLNLAQHQSKKCTTTQNKHQKLKRGLLAFYDIQPGHGAGLFSKEKISKGGDKSGRSEENRTNGEAYNTNKQTVYI